VPEFTGRAPAKVNLVLEVLGRRPDGYHELDTVLQATALYDTLTISDEGEPGVFLSGRYAEGAPADRTNSAWRAAEALAARIGEDAGALRISIDKRVPAAGGLGGGSSDAATALRLLQRLWPRATEADIVAAAASVGSDELFFLSGGTARARGRGENVTRLAPLPRHGIVLCISPATLERKTARLFAALDDTPFDTGERVDAFLAGHPRALRTTDLFNAFERVAFAEFPGLGELRDKLQARLGEEVRLAGAGPTLFWIGPEVEVGRVTRAVEGLDCTVIPASTAGPDG
jgi:4-diphosphocytidyl-2-C-methyl-D-erythritol kinase